MQVNIPHRYSVAVVYQQIKVNTVGGGGGGGGQQQNEARFVVTPISGKAAWRRPFPAGGGRPSASTDRDPRQVRFTFQTSLGANQYVISWLTTRRS